MSAIGAAIGYGYVTVRSNPRITLSYTIVGTIVGYFFIFIFIHMAPWKPTWFGFIFLLQLAVYFYIFTALAKISLELANNHPVNDDPLSSLPYLKEYTELAFCIVLLTLFIIVGLIFFIIPGIYITLRYGMSFWILLEENIISTNKFLYSLRRNSELTRPKGIKFTIFIILFVITFFFHVIYSIVISFNTTTALIISSLIQNFEFVFQTIVLAQIYVQLKSLRARGEVS